MDLNRVLLIGNLTRDPETRHTQTGKQVTKFDIAVNDRRGGRDNETTMFIRIETWGKTAEIAAQYLQKGGNVLVEGRLKIEEYETRDGQKRRDPVVVADQISLGPRPRGAEGGAPSNPAPRSSAPARPSSPPQRGPAAGNAMEESPKDYSDDQIDEPAQRGGTEDDLPF